jgi:hypothetical protein
MSHTLLGVDLTPMLFLSLVWCAELGRSSTAVEIHCPCGTSGTQFCDDFAFHDILDRRWFVGATGRRKRLARVGLFWKSLRRSRWDKGCCLRGSAIARGCGTLPVYRYQVRDSGLRRFRMHDDLLNSGNGTQFFRTKKTETAVHLFLNRPR